MTSEDEARKLLEYADQYDKSLDTYERLTAIVVQELKTAVGSTGIKTHSITGRVKERKSFIEKIERKGYDDPFTQTKDLVAARVVTLLSADLGAADRAIRSCFEVMDRDDKERKAEPENFSYTSIHYDCGLKHTHVDAENYHLVNITFEVQLRTVLTDAWASIEHYLAYKGASSIPREIRRDLSALKGLLHVADKQFQGIDAQLQDIQAKAAAANPGDLHLFPLNLATVKGLLRRLFVDRDESADRDYSEFVEQLNRCGYENLKQVNEAIAQGLATATANEAISPPFDPATMQPSRFTDAGLAKLAVSITDERMNQLLLDSAIDDVDSFLMDEYDGH
ncbi:GTP pyrophosphokinase [Rhodococcus sp. NPDC004095]